MDELEAIRKKKMEQIIKKKELESYPDKPITVTDGDFNQFGNLKPKAYGDIETSETREPLIDVFKEKDLVRVIAEVPGINKGDINLTGTEETLRIIAHSESRKYEKAVSLPVPVNISTAKAKYKNGVLEVIIKRKKDANEDEGHKIDVE